MDLIPDYRAPVNIILTKNERFLILAKATQVGVNEKEPGNELLDYVEKLITQYIQMYAE